MHWDPPYKHHTKTIYSAHKFQKNHLPHAAGGSSDKTHALLPQFEFLDLAAGRFGVVVDPEDMFGY